MKTIINLTLCLFLGIFFTACEKTELLHPTKNELTTACDYSSDDGKIVALFLTHLFENGSSQMAALEQTPHDLATYILAKSKGFLMNWNLQLSNEFLTIIPNDLSIFNMDYGKDELVNNQPILTNFEKEFLNQFYRKKHKIENSSELGNTIMQIDDLACFVNTSEDIINKKLILGTLSTTKHVAKFWHQVANTEGHYINDKRRDIIWWNLVHQSAKAYLISGLYGACAIGVSSSIY